MKSNKELTDLINDELLLKIQIQEDLEEIITLTERLDFLTKKRVLDTEYLHSLQITIEDFKANTF